MSVASAHLNGGFARAADLKADDVLTDLAAAEDLVASEEGAVAHMNADHAEACRLYATKLLGAREADWACVGLDPDGLDLQHGQSALRLAFPQRVTGPAELRAILKRLAEEARRY